MRIHVYSRNEFVCDDHIGVAELPFGFKHDIAEEYALPLVADDGTNSGTIFVKLYTTT